MSGALAADDYVYISYPRRRDARDTPSILHDHDWADAERTQQQVWRRRPDAGDYIEITPTISRVTKTGKRIDVEFKDGARASADEYGESQPGMVIGKVRGA